MKAAMLGIAVVVLAACASGMVGEMPQIKDPATAATVIVIRPRHVTMSTTVIPVTLDGFEILALGPGEHVTFKVPAGERVVGVNPTSTLSLTPQERAQLVKAEPGQTYYFTVSPAVGGSASIARIEPEAAKPLIAETKPLRVDR